jgi:hypothetical protein
MQLPAYATCSLHELLKEGGDGFTMQRFDGESTPHAASGYRPTPPPATSGVNDPYSAQYLEAGNARWKRIHAVAQQQQAQQQQQQQQQAQQ